MSIRIQDISKTFGKFEALKKVNLDVRTGEMVALLGPSGSGKTTLLRIIAGLEFADEGDGHIQFHGEEVTDRTAYERRAGFVFQHYALFNHMSVADNIAFGLNVQKRAQKPSRDEIQQRVQHLLERIQLQDFGHRFPAQLSGGQRQRVALARALAVEPRVLLLDEPFGALDAKVRKELRKWLRQFHEQNRITSVFVTHDQDEAFELADRVVILHEGHIQQVGSPTQLRENPKNEFVADFLDCVMI
jgi:sulfate transport system ATP-binding protein